MKHEIYSINFSFILTYRKRGFPFTNINVGGTKTKKKLPVFHVTLGLGLRLYLKHC